MFSEIFRKSKFFKKHMVSLKSRGITAEVIRSNEVYSNLRSLSNGIGSTIEELKDLHTQA